MSDNDLIRRGDVLALAHEIGLLPLDEIASIPAAQPAPVTPQEAAQIICDTVLHMASSEGAEMRAAMINATMSVRVTSVSRWKRWVMVNEALRALAGDKT